MITRVWHGWTHPQDAEAYETLLTTEVFPEIQGKNIAGLRHIELLRRYIGDEVEFMVVIRFDDAESVRAMTGGSQSRAYVPDAARKILKRFEETARHFEHRYSGTADIEVRHV